MSSRGGKISYNLVTEEDMRALRSRIAPPGQEGFSRLLRDKGGGPLLGTGRTVGLGATPPGSFTGNSVPSTMEMVKINLLRSKPHK